MDDQENFQAPQTPAGEETGKPKIYKQRKFWVFVIALFFVALAGIFVYKNYLLNQSALPKWAQVPKGLVADKVSKSAAIAVNLPPGETSDLAKIKSQVVFEPEIQGQWQAGESEKQFLFKPQSELSLGKSYRATFTGRTGKIQKDFTADEDPQVSAIFPGNNSEADELSEIVISFNRPMVALSALSEIEKAPVPVKITPATEGTFKWAGTRTLKFIPKTHLVRSSHYKVEAGPGFVSMDGLETAPTSSAFTTRPLRYLENGISNGLTLYHQPAVLRFNQPVDLEKTKGMIEVKEGDRKINITVEYGTRSVVLGKDGKPADYLDKTTLNVFQAKDKNNREKFWDNNKTYNLTIKGAAPLEGDIALSETQTAQIKVPEVLAGLSATSERSNLASPQLFDPQGKLVAEFYEEVDKDASKIGLKGVGIKNIEYGEQCRLDENGNPIYLADSCEKESNKKQLIISFNESDLKPGQNVPISFEKVINLKGLQINSESVKKEFTVYPPLKILGSYPAGQEQSADLTYMEICSNSPLVDAQVDTFPKMFKSNISVGKWDWQQAYRVESQNQGGKCAPGQYDSRVRYGLRPESDYKIDLNLTDHFGQNVSYSISFRSGKIASINRNLTAMQKDYNVASPDHTKLTFAAENLEYVDAHVCKIAPETLLAYLNYSTRPSPLAPGQNLNCTQAWQKRIDLPQKYWDLNYFQINLKDIVGDGNLGFYVLSLSHPDLREQVYNYTTNQYELGRQIFVRSLLNITKLAAQEKKVEVQDGQQQERFVERSIISKSQGNLYWVSEIGSLKALEGADIKVYQENDKKFTAIGSGITDNGGVARTKAYSGNGAAIVTYLNDQTLVFSQQDKFQWASSYRGGNKTYIYSDRPIYRPGQEVDIKGLYRVGYDDNYEVFKDKPAHLEVYNSKNETILSQDLPISDAGTFNAKVVLPNEAPLGSYRVEALGGYYSFDVEDYAPSAFKVEASSDKEEYIAGDTAKLTVDANYYFDVPVEGGSVEYALLSQDYYFDRYTDQYFNFGSGWYYNPYPYYGDNYILRDKTALNSQGKAEISQVLDFNKFFKDDARKQSKIFVLRVTVKNSMGQSVSAEKSFIVHRGEFYLGVNTEKNYLGANQPNKLLIKSVDINGKPKSVSDISVTVNRIEWNYFKRQEVDGNYYYHSEKKTVEVEKFNVSTNSSGDYGKDFKLGKEGEYEIDLAAKDSRGNELTSSQNVYVYGSGTVDVRPLNNESLDLAVENQKVEVGQTASVLIKSPYVKARALIAIERGRILDYKIVDVDQNFYNYTFPVKEEYIPNFYVTVLLLSSDPQVKFGQSQFFVNTKEKTLSVEAKPGKNSYLPGEEVTLDVTTKDAKGQPVSAEVSVSVADLSVLALVGNPKKDPVTFFYDGMPLAVTTSSNIKNILTEAEIPAGTKGGGGGEPSDLAKKKRGVFKDTAFWQANVVTGQDGKAQVKFTLPDNLTTWQIESLGLTKDTRLGVGYTEFQSKKQLMVVPLKPRFILPGDEFVVGAQVFNQTAASQKLDVTFDSGSLEILSNKKTSLKIEAGKSGNVYFKVKAPLGITSGEHKFTVSAKNSGYEDTVEESFPIERNEMYESVATSNYTTDANASEFVWLPANVLKDRGGVTVKASATLMGSLPDALNYLVQYPYGCTEQMLSKISTVALLKRLQKIPNLGEDLKIADVEFDGQKYSADDVVGIGLSRIMSNQTPQGGFAYYPNMKPDFYLTLNVMSSFSALREAGYKIDQGAEARAAAYLLDEFNSQKNYYQDKNTLVMLAAALAASPAASAQFESIRSRVTGLLDDARYVNENISNVSLLKLLTAAITKFPAKYQDQVFKILENRVLTDARGAYLSPGENQGLWYFYENPATDTALFLKAIARGKRDYVFTDKLIRFLLGVRAKDGSWATTNSTFAALDAMTDYINWKQETNSRFKLSLSLDGKEQTRREFGGKTILNNLTAFLPAADFSSEKLSELKFSKENLNNLPNGFYYDAQLKYYLPIDQIAPRDEGFNVERELYQLDDKNGERPVSQAKVGDVLRGHLTITVSKQRNLVAVESFIPAGMELVNFNFATEDQTLNGQTAAPEFNPYVEGAAITSGSQKPVEVAKPGFWARIWRWIVNLFRRKPAASVPAAEGELPDMIYSRTARIPHTLFADATEYHDDRLMLFSGSLEPGVYEYDYFVRALVPGKFQYLPATAYELYSPENFGRTMGGYFEIKQQ